MYEFKLPDLGEGIHEGEILKWHVKEGDVIVADAPLLDVETDKAAVTIPSPRGGKVVKLNGAVGSIAHTGSVIAVVDDGAGAAAAAAPAAATVAAAPAAAVAAVAATPAAASRGNVPAAPATRKLAREMGIDINRVAGSGPGGRVTPEDVKAFAAGGAAAAAEPAATAGGATTGTTTGATTTVATSAATVGAATVSAAPTSAAPTGLAGAEREAAIATAREKLGVGGGTSIPFYDLDPLPDFRGQGPCEVVPLRSIRRRTAHKMVTSMTIIPHVGHQDEADVLELEKLRKGERERLEGVPGGRLTLMAFVIKAVAMGLRKYPMFNASLDPFTEEIFYKKYYNIGVAVDTPNGLIVPNIRECDRKSVIEISAELESIAARAREGKLTPYDLSAGTFTITNVGPMGGNGIVPVVNYPECAILGLGRAKDKPVVRNGEIAVGKLLPLNLGYDHRVADGADAGRFTTYLLELLESPARLLIGG